MEFEISELNEYFSVLRLDKTPDTIRVYTNAMRKFIDFSGAKTIEDLRAITPARCREFQTWMKEQGLQATSINTALRPLKIIFNWLVENDYLDETPWQKVKFMKMGKKERPFLSEEEIDKLFTGVKRLEDKAIIALLLTTGVRNSELTGIKLSDFKDCHILVNGKGNKQRYLIVPPDVCEILNEYVAKRIKRHGDNSEYLFVSKAGGRFSGNAIREKIKGAMTRAGFPKERIEEIAVHSMRHTFATNMMESGTDIRILQSALGHANIAITAGTYAHVRRSALDNAMLNQKSIFGKDRTNV